MFEIVYYRFEDGQAPVEDFIDTLEVKMQAKVFGRKYRNKYEVGDDMDDFEKHLNRKMQNPEFKAAWEDSEAECNLIRAMIKARKSVGLTQEQLSARTGIDQAILSRIENGKANPSIGTLQKLAKGLGKRLVIEFK